MKTDGRMNTDTPLSLCRTGEVRWAKNRVIPKGQQYSVNEGGVEVVQSLARHRFLGVIITDKEQILFANWNDDGVKRFCIYTWSGLDIVPIIKTRYISFNDDDFIEGVYQYNNNGERIISFWNGIDSRCNNARLINIDDLPFTVNNYFEIVPTSYNTENELADMTLMNPPRNEVNIDAMLYPPDGLIKTGKYSFSITYLLGEDEVYSTIPTNSIFVENFTNWPINERCETYQGYLDDIGPVVNSTLYNYKLSKPDEIINQSITIVINDLDRRYKKFHLNIIHFANGATSVSRIENIFIDSSTKVIKYSGVVDKTNIALEKILDTRFLIDKIQSGGILRDRLYIAGFTDESEFNYQKYANNIITEVVVETVTSNDFIAKSSFMPDEAYAMYIHLVYKNGKISRGFHIPGRLPLAGEKDAFYDIGAQLNSPCKKYHAGIDYHPTLYTGYWENENITYNDWKEENKEIWDANGYTGVKITDEVENIRLIRMPSVSNLKNIQPSNKFEHAICYPKFSNIYIPPKLANLVQGYIITYAKKETEDSHVFGYGSALGNQLTANIHQPIDTLRYYGFDNLSVKNTPILNFVKEVGHSENIGVWTQYGGVYLPKTNYPSNINEQHLHPISEAVYRTSNNANNNDKSNECLSVKLKNEIDNLYWAVRYTLSTSQISCEIDEGGIVYGAYYGSVPMIVLFTQYLDLHRDIHNQTLCSTGVFFSIDGAGTYETNKQLQADCELVTDTVRLVQGITYSAFLGKYICPMPMITYNRIPNRCRTFPDYPGSFKHFLKHDRDYYFNQYEVYVEAKRLNTIKIPAPEPANKHISNFNRKTIIRSIPYNLETNNNNWREFYPLNTNNLPNFLVMPTEINQILHVEIGLKEMYIQCVEGLYVSSFKSQITSEVSLQETDVFEVAPHPIKNGNLNIKCQHKTACKLTPMGYVVVDKPNQKIYLIGEEIKEISNENNSKLIWEHLNKVTYVSELNNVINIAYDYEYDNIMINCVYRDLVFISETEHDAYVPPVGIKNPIENTQPLFPIGGDNSFFKQNPYIYATMGNKEGYFELQREYIGDKEDYIAGASYYALSYETLTSPALFDYKGIAFRYNNGWISYNTHNANLIYSQGNRLYSMGGKYKKRDYNHLIYILNNYTKAGIYQHSLAVATHDSFVDFIVKVDNVQTFMLLKNFIIKTRSTLQEDYRNDVYENNDNYNETIDHYAVYNNHQSSGKISIEEKRNQLISKITHNYTDWNIDEFKDILKESTVAIYDNLGNLINIEEDRMWFEKGNFIDNVVVIRVYIDYNKQIGNRLEYFTKRVEILDVDIQIKPFIK